jgi:Carboxypeptidase regulatory-like domain
VNARRVLAALAAGVALATAAPLAPRADITGLPPAGVGMRRGDYPDTTVTGDIAGVVRELRDGTVIPFANVFVIGTRLGAMTDESGRFRVSRIPAGLHKLCVVSVGFARESLDVFVPARGVADTTIELGFPDDRPLVDLEPPDETVLDLIRHAGEVRIYRLDGARPFVGAASFEPQADASHIGGWYVAREIRAPSKGWVRKLKRAVGSRTSYIHGRGRWSSCGADPEFGFRFRRGNAMADVEIRDDCNRVLFQSTIAQTSRATCPINGPIQELESELANFGAGLPPRSKYAHKDGSTSHSSRR